MASKKIEIFILVFSILLLIILNYKTIDSLVIAFLDDAQTVKVQEVIDGDTIKAKDLKDGENLTVRLLGVNAPERGEFLYQEAKKFLESEILNETVELKFGKDRYDQYKRTLAYVYSNNKNVNLKIVENGFANFYFPSGKDQYYKGFKDAWQKCTEKGINLCEKSKDMCGSCIYIKELSVKNQEIIIYNNCSFSCILNGWNIEDEGRKKFIFENFTLKNNSQVSVIHGNKTNTDSTIYWSEYPYILTKLGDSIFLRDKQGKLVDWKNY